ncbi:MAG: FumA C-terminus/TtdB family hydratase beta subunit [Bacillota bacterium]|jgi:fumarate hydratase subunit beta
MSETNITVTFPVSENDLQLKNLCCGQKVLISGIVYTARDAAHKKMVQLIKSGNDLPMEIKGAMIYYAGPAPTPPGKIIGSIGPTTSARMDKYAPIMIEHGLRGLLGKGKHNQQVAAACHRYGAVYFATFGGAAALLSQKVLKKTVIAWPELGTEAICKLEVENLPAVVAIDSRGNNLFCNLK